ncbi:MAG TPA: hypothetical protein DIW32_05905 [Eubacterium sp.]|nr:hypothetical protein [Eubacterium sp.]
MCPRALSTDAYKWSQKVGAGRTDRKRPRLQWTQSQLSTHRRSPTKSEGDSAENLIDGADGEQSLRLDGRKACNIKRVGISQAESNKATVCALPSIHLPLTRDGHGCPKLNAQRLCTDAKPTERSYGKNIVHGKG